MKTIIQSLSLLALSFITCHAYALEVADVKLNPSIQLAEEKLTLNGAGIRTKFFFKIYVGALYLPNKTNDARAIISSSTNKSIIMHFLYSEVSKEKLVDAWNEGFKANLTKSELTALTEKINSFNKLFVTVKKNDRIEINFRQNDGTEIRLNGKTLGKIAGLEFHQALLKIWLGKNPVTTDLKNALLGK